MEQTQSLFGMLLQKAVKIRTHIWNARGGEVWSSGREASQPSRFSITVLYRCVTIPKRPTGLTETGCSLQRSRCSVLFATLADRIHSRQRAEDATQTKRRLQGHPDHRCRGGGVEFPGGSLGIGLSAASYALAGKIEQRKLSSLRVLGRWGVWTRARHGRRPWQLPEIQTGAILRLSSTEMGYSRTV